jgi:two-component system, chemotaxis family, response regulator Rcp1
MADANRRSQVALIEDNPADVYLVREALRVLNLNCELTVYPTFEGAIEAVQSGALSQPDAFVIDLNLRTGSGLDILEAIRRDEGLRDTAVAILTSSDSPRDRAAANQLGANLYIRKPSELDSFLHEVGSAIAELTGGSHQCAASS